MRTLNAMRAVLHPIATYRAAARRRAARRRFTAQVEAWTARVDAEHPCPNPQCHQARDGMRNIVAELHDAEANADLRT